MDQQTQEFELYMEQLFENQCNASNSIMNTFYEDFNIQYTSNDEFILPPIHFSLYCTEDISDM